MPQADGGSPETASASGPGHEAYHPLRDRLVWLILLVYLALAITYSYVMLLGQAPDESDRHFPYVRWLAHTWALPSDDPAVTGGNLELHPPLYYLLLTPLYLASEQFGDMAAMRVLRWTSPFVVLAALLLWLQIIWHACGRQRRSFLFIFALTAWWPNLFVDAGAITNDVGAILASVVLLYLVAVKYWHDRTVKVALLLGVVAGLGALMKASTMPPSFTILAVALIWQHGRRFYRDGDFWMRGLALAAAFLAVCGWWYLRNYEIYGALTPFPQGYRGIPYALSNWEGVLYGYAGPLLVRGLNGLWASAFAGIVWFPDSTHPVIYNVLRLLSVLAAIGLIIAIRRWRKGELTIAADQAPALALACVGFATLWLSALWMAVFVHMAWYQGGRYLLLYLPGLVLPLGLGLHELFRRLRSPMPYLVTLCWFVFLSFVAWYHIWTYHNPIVRAAIEAAQK